MRSRSTRHEAGRGQTRTLVSVPPARWALLPRGVRLAAAAREIRGRCLRDADLRTSLLPLVLDLLPRPEPAQHVESAHGPIWQYWDSGFANAPPLVRSAARSVDRHAWAPVVRLAASNLMDFVDIPEAVLAKRHAMSQAHFSDVIRLNLLAQHGGVWVDATVMLSAPRPESLSALPFFAFTRPEDPRLLSTWYMQSSSSSPLVVRWRDALNEYWAREASQRDYFLVHFLFEALVTLEPAARRDWDQVPVLSHLPPHRLQRALPLPWDEGRVRSILRSSWLHKLTYRPPTPSAFRSGSTAHVLSQPGFVA